MLNGAACQCLHCINHRQRFNDLDYCLIDITLQYLEPDVDRREFTLTDLRSMPKLPWALHSGIGWLLWADDDLPIPLYDKMLTALLSIPVEYAFGGWEPQDIGEE